MGPGDVLEGGRGDAGPPAQVESDPEELKDVSGSAAGGAVAAAMDALLRSVVDYPAVDLGLGRIVLLCHSCSSAL